MKNWKLPGGIQDNWWGQAKNEEAAKTSAIASLATKHGVKQSEVTVLTCSEVVR